MPSNGCYSLASLMATCGFKYLEVKLDGSGNSASLHVRNVVASWY